MSRVAANVGELNACDGCGAVHYRRDIAGVGEKALCPSCWWKWREGSVAPPDPVALAIDTIIHSWERWDAEAGQQAQQEQHPDAYYDTLAGHLRSVIEPLVKGGAA